MVLKLLVVEHINMLQMMLNYLMLISILMVLVEFYMIVVWKQFILVDNLLYHYI